MSSGKSLAHLIRPSISESTTLFLPIDISSLVVRLVAGEANAYLGPPSALYCCCLASMSSFESVLVLSSSLSSSKGTSLSIMSSMMSGAEVTMLVPVPSYYMRSRPAFKKASAFLNLFMSYEIWSVKNFLVSISCKFSILFYYW